MRISRIVRNMRLFGWSIALVALIGMAGCSSKTVSVNFKVNSEPEGAHILYRATGADLPYGERWIYLGNTPLRGVHQFSEDELEEIDKITMKVFRDGYHEQKIEWDGPTFWEQAEGRGVIFWTPELIPISD